LEEPKMTTTMQVPHGALARIREGAQSELRFVLAEELADTIEEPDAFQAVLPRVEAMWRMLDALDEKDADTVQVDVGEHGAALLAAITAILPVLVQAVADSPGDTGRAGELRLIRQLAAQVRALRRSA
jgi:hypothetical protein